VLAHVLDEPRKSIKSLITNEVTTVFMAFLCTSTTCTIKRISISGYGNLVFAKKLNIYRCISNSSAVLFQEDICELKVPKKKVKQQNRLSETNIQKPVVSIQSYPSPTTFSKIQYAKK
jgi:hypothetical protein